MRFQHHLFICTNQRAEGHSCANRGSLDLLKAIKAALRARGLDHEGGIMANKSGCFGLCQQGPNVVVYPSGAWHRIQNAQQAATLIDTLLLDHNESKNGTDRVPNPAD